MCGIAGYIGRRRPSDVPVSACVARMQRRGPDAQGVYRHVFRDDWHVCMIHARLSIIDLKFRPEPLQRDRCALSFNGEIYNYVELKKDLLRRGEAFVTTGDTEVLLAGLNRFGVEWLDEVEGMWAFAYYD